MELPELINHKLSIKKAFFRINCIFLGNPSDSFWQNVNSEDMWERFKWSSRIFGVLISCEIDIKSKTKYVIIFFIWYSIPLFDLSGVQRDSEKNDSHATKNISSLLYEQLTQIIPSKFRKMHQKSMLLLFFRSSFVSLVF